MSKDHEGDIRQYIHVAEAWYAESSLSNKEPELDDVDITPEQFCQMLDACGFIDDTPRKYEESYPNKYGVK